MASVFALPIPNSRPGSSTATTRAKRRRRGTKDEDGEDGIETQDDTQQIEEYAAILTPDERSQRRLAGHSLISDLPRAPFPHRSRLPDSKLHARAPLEKQTDDGDGDSLRIQHIAAMSAVLHKCLLKKDYVRVCRALGLLLRTDIYGKPIDIRAAGNWAIGAEVLFRQYEKNEAVGNRHERLRKGFLQAKALYEMLIIQYPPHRTWPDSVNAVDFYLSMFSLWIYVAQVEGRDLQNAEHTDQDMRMESADGSRVETIRDIKVEELKQANEIGARMDKCMTSAAYSNNEHLTRLREMVADWQADLVDDCRDLAPEEGLEVPETWPYMASIATDVESLNLNDSHT